MHELQHAMEKGLSETNSNTIPSPLMIHSDISWYLMMLKEPFIWQMEWWIATSIMEIFTLPRYSCNYHVFGLLSLQQKLKGRSWFILQLLLQKWKRGNFLLLSPRKRKIIIFHPSTVSTKTKSHTCFAALFSFAVNLSTTFTLPQIPSF